METDGTARPGSSIRVMLADADPLARRALREALVVGPDLEVVAEASDQAATVQVALENRPDIVFADAELAGSDLPSWLRELARVAPSSAVVVLSVAVDRDTGLDVLRAGAAGYLAKSTNPESLPRLAQGVARGEAAISRQLTKQVIDRLRSISPQGVGIRPVRSDLTPRQWEIIDLLRRNTPESALAPRLGITAAAARRQLRGLLAKFKASSAEELVQIAQRLVVEAASDNGS